MSPCAAATNALASSQAHASASARAPGAARERIGSSGASSDQSRANPRGEPRETSTRRSIRGLASRRYGGGRHGFLAALARGGGAVDAGGKIGGDRHGPGWG